MVDTGPEYRLIAEVGEKSLCIYGLHLYGLFFASRCPAALKMGLNCVGCTGHKAHLETILFTAIIRTRSSHFAIIRMRQ